MNIDVVLDRIRKSGTEAHAFSSVPHLLEPLIQEARPDDVILIMSNGGFGGLHQDLLEYLSTHCSD